LDVPLVAAARTEQRLSDALQSGGGLAARPHFPTRRAARDLPAPMPRFPRDVPGRQSALGRIRKLVDAQPLLHDGTAGPAPTRTIFSRTPRPACSTRSASGT
jgi:hypothetical protein